LIDVFNRDRSLDQNIFISLAFMTVSYLYLRHTLDFKLDNRIFERLHCFVIENTRLFFECNPKYRFDWRDRKPLENFRKILRIIVDLWRNDSAIQFPVESLLILITNRTRTRLIMLVMLS